jgi:hypothetical protein
LDELKRRLIKKFKLLSAEKDSYKASVHERRLTIRVHNTFKEIVRPQIINLLPPVFEEKKAEYVFLAGAD